ncbi:sodium:calcium antiporter [Chloroflexota bacterium]
MKNWLWLGGVTLATLPALVMLFRPLEAAPAFGILFYGVAILGAAFLLNWAAEVVQLDVSQALALAFLAIIAVLPEYAVDVYFSWIAGKDISYAPYAAANMTGANRLLIGIGWALVLFLFWVKGKEKTLELKKSQSIELSFLLLATLYILTVPIKGALGIGLHLVDSMVLFTLFGLYIWVSLKADRVEPELVGPSRAIASLSTPLRRSVTVLIFLFSGLIIVSVAKPFAEGLLATGKTLGIDEFILVQWIAPLASEAPELTIASLLVLRGAPRAGMGVLLSSKVNQWTLLVGTLPLVYAISSGGVEGLPLDSRQVGEVMLTAAQSLLAIVILAKLRFSSVGAAVLFTLFATQLVFFGQAVRLGYAGLYLALAVGLLLIRRGHLQALFQMVHYTLDQLRNRK